MTLREEIAMNLEQIPENKLSVLLHFERFLIECPVSLGMPEKPKGRPRDLIGALKGKIWVADDFDEPLELVSSKELRELREFREQKNAEIQEAAV